MATIILNTLAKLQSLQIIAVTKGLTTDLDCAPEYVTMYFHDWSRPDSYGSARLIPFKLFGAETEKDCEDFIAKIEKFVSNWQPKQA